MTHSNTCPATLRHVPGDWLISWQWWLDLCAECTARITLATSDLAAVLAGEKPVGWWV